MGSKYTSQVVSGYNSSPPPDDGTTVAANKITWGSTIKAKLADPILTLAQAVNSAIASFADFSQTAASSAYTTVGSDHMKSVEVTGTTTISLMDATSAGAGYIVNIVNVGTNTVTVSRATGANTLNGATKDIKLAPGASVIAKVNLAATGYEVMAAFNTLFDQTDPSKQITHVLSGITTGTVRSVTWPDASITVARIDAAQTFSGNQSFAALVDISGASAGQVKYPATQNASSDPNTQDDYDEYPGVAAACTGALTTTVTWTITKVGRLVTLHLPATLGTTTAAPTFAYGTVIPTKYRPPTDRAYVTAIIQNNGAAVAQPGLIAITAASGVITGYRDPVSTNFTNGVVGGIQLATDVSWRV